MAIKVQRPDVLKSITVDVQLLRYFISVVQKAARITRDLRGLADEVGKGLIGECDFRQEAANANEFIKAHKYMDFIMVPKVFKELNANTIGYSLECRPSDAIVKAFNPGAKCIKGKNMMIGDPFCVERYELA